MKSDKKVYFNIAVDKNLKEGFIKCCHASDKTASQVIRDYMRKYVAVNGQKSLNF